MIKRLNKTKKLTQGYNMDVVENFISTTNSKDIKGALALFTNDAVINDPSVGRNFDGIDQVRVYVERFFVGYNTTTKLLRTEQVTENIVKAYVDFTGDFGHETGYLQFETNENELIIRVDADLD
jgi:ketosteroid isomerase-like protein